MKSFTIKVQNKFPKLLFKSKSDIIKDISISSKLNTELIIKKYSKKIENKYSEIIDIFTEKYIYDLYNRISSNGSNQFIDAENGQLLIHKEGRKYILLLSESMLIKNLKQKIDWYNDNNWSTKKLYERINLTPEIYRNLLKSKVIHLKIYNKSFVESKIPAENEYFCRPKDEYSTFTLEISTLPDEELKKIEFIPEWSKTLIFPPGNIITMYSEKGNTFRKEISYKECHGSSASENFAIYYLSKQQFNNDTRKWEDNGSTEEKSIFFNKFKINFLNGNFFDIEEKLNYAFLLMNYITLSDMDLDEKSKHLYNLGICYPKTFPYHIDISKKHILKKI